MLAHCKNKAYFHNMYNTYYILHWAEEVQGRTCNKTIEIDKLNNRNRNRKGYIEMYFFS